MNYDKRKCNTEMAIYKGANRGDGFSVVSNAMIRDKNLSFKARGLLMYMLSHSGEWSMTIGSIATLNDVGRDQVRTALNEIETAGYAKRVQHKSAGGKFAETDWFIYDYPHFESEKGEPVADNPLPETPLSDYPTPDNPILKKEQLKKYQSKENQGEGRAAALASKPAPERSKKTTATRLPDGWQPDEKLIQQMNSELVEMGVSLNLEFEHRKFTDYYMSVSGAKGRKADWRATWRNWIRRAAQDAQGKRKPWNESPAEKVDYYTQMAQRIQQQGELGL